MTSRISEAASAMTAVSLLAAGKASDRALNQSAANP